MRCHESQWLIGLWHDPICLPHVTHCTQELADATGLARTESAALGPLERQRRLRWTERLQTTQASLMVQVCSVWADCPPSPNGQQGGACPARDVYVSWACQMSALYCKELDNSVSNTTPHPPLPAAIPSSKGRHCFGIWEAQQNTFSKGKEILTGRTILQQLFLT